jgi:hypothetical protein
MLQRSEYCIFYILQCRLCQNVYVFHCKLCQCVYKLQCTKYQNTYIRQFTQINLEMWIFPSNNLRSPTARKEILLFNFVSSALESVGWSAQGPCRFTSRKYSVPIAQKARWTPRLLWTYAKPLSPTVNRCLNRPAHRRSRYWLRDPWLTDFLLLLQVKIKFFDKYLRMTTFIQHIDNRKTFNCSAFIYN